MVMSLFCCFLGGESNKKVGNLSMALLWVWQYTVKKSVMQSSTKKVSVWQRSIRPSLICLMILLQHFWYPSQAHPPQWPPRGNLLHSKQADRHPRTKWIIHCPALAKKLMSLNTNTQYIYIQTVYCLC